MRRRGVWITSVLLVAAAAALVTHSVLVTVAVLAAGGCLLAAFRPWRVVTTEVAARRHEVRVLERQRQSEASHRQLRTGPWPPIIGGG